MAHLNKPFPKSGASTFPKGIHPNGMKYLAEEKEITVMPAPSVVYIPVVQHTGGPWAKPSTPKVEAGQTVKKGQLIAESSAWNGAHIHASVSGRVKGIEKRSLPDGRKIDHIVIENDGLDTEELMPPLHDPTPQEIVARVKAAGIVGMGGAGFPSDVKLSPRTPVEAILINAAECEPYITCDDRILQELTEQFVAGAKLMAKAVGVKKIYIGLEINKPYAGEALMKYEELDPENFVIVPLKKKYPQGAEKQLVYASLKYMGKSKAECTVPVGKLPSDVGVVVTNVHTALSVYQAVVEGKSSYQRIMTVTGLGVKNPANLWVRYGTPMSEVLEHCGGLVESGDDADLVKIISGGPMMGGAMNDLEAVSTKTFSNIIFMTRQETNLDNPTQCISCRRCIKVCPMNLMPNMIDECVEAGDYHGAKAYQVSACIECGCCQFICPAKRKLVTNIRIGKDKSRGL